MKGQKEVFLKIFFNSYFISVLCLPDVIRVCLRPKNVECETARQACKNHILLSDLWSLQSGHSLIFFFFIHSLNQCLLTTY